MQEFLAFLERINAITLSAPALIAILGVGALFTLWSGFAQYRSLTHGLRLVAGRGIDTTRSAGALTHFQALSTALSGTIGLGNIAGVAIAIELGGPGAVFWMWVVGFVGMALKSTEVTLSLMYRDVSDPKNPHGGMMYVCRNGLATLGPGWATLGKIAGAFFGVCVLVFAITGGNMFQAWSVADTTQAYFGLAPWKTGLILAALVGLVLLGGIRRLGATAAALVPFMCVIYVFGGLWVLSIEAEKLPGVIREIFRCAFAPAEASGAFTGAAVGSAFIYGMRRALFSSESGLGTAPIAHSAVRTPEPVTEGVVAGLEPFIDTIVVCTITALVVLVSGVWNRAPLATWNAPPTIVSVEANQWKPSNAELPTQDTRKPFRPGQSVFAVVEIDGKRHRLDGVVRVSDASSVDEGIGIEWNVVTSVSTPVLAENGVFADFRGSTMAALAFDSARPGLGKWMVTVAVWLFAFATIIAYGYYGEQTVAYFGGGPRSVLVYRIAWCTIVAATCLGYIKTSVQLDTLSTVAMGFMYAVNLPLLLVLGPQVMRTWHDYFRRLHAGQIR
ncbi:MAG TPA: amino acid carrier protein [Nevskiaceae bacterium]|nr:amino acid carrier protein [Nevskiaceae bacterium]